MGWETIVAYVGIVGIGLFPVGAVVLHALPTGYRPLRNPLSDYAGGRYGVLMTIAFLVLGIGVLALDAGLGTGLGAGKRVAIGVFFIGVFGASRLLAAFFRSDADGAERTGRGRIHTLLAALGFIAIPLAAIVLTPVFERVPSWTAVAPPLRILELLIVVFGLIMLLTRMQVLRFIFGLVERLFYVSALLWLFLIGLHFALLGH